MSRRRDATWADYLLPPSAGRRGARPSLSSVAYFSVNKQKRFTLNNLTPLHTAVFRLWYSNTFSTSVFLPDAAVHGAERLKTPTLNIRIIAQRIPPAQIHCAFQIYRPRGHALPSLPSSRYFLSPNPSPLLNNTVNYQLFLPLHDNNPKIQNTHPQHFHSG